MSHRPNRLPLAVRTRMDRPTTDALRVVSQRLHIPVSLFVRRAVVRELARTLRYCIGPVKGIDISMGYREHLLDIVHACLAAGVKDADDPSNPRYSSVTGKGGPARLRKSV